MIEFVSGLLAVLLSLALLSYLVAENPVYRLAVHLFVGLSAGYAAVLAWQAVIVPELIAPLLGLGAPGASLAAVGGRLVWPILPALAGGVLLVLKAARVSGRAGTLLVLAPMVGVGAAVAVGGAITGTLIPQTQASFVSLLPAGAGDRLLELAVEGLFVVAGTLATLGFFYYGSRARPGDAGERPALIRPVAAVGQVFIGVAFGVMYAGAVAASVAIFAERSAAIWATLSAFVGR
jgi:hypothetical protein